MNYVWYHLKHDPKFWVKVVIIPAVLAVADQALFERQREGDFRKTIAQNPGFQTFCYTCVHFNTEIKACRLDIRNTKARAMPLNDRFKYCLYWESMNRSS